jgi:hypothetical protein
MSNLKPFPQLAYNLPEVTFHGLMASKINMNKYFPWLYTNDHDN